MLWLILGIVLFLGAHSIPASPRLQALQAKIIGEDKKNVFITILSVIGFGLIIWGYGQAREQTIFFYQLPSFVTHIVWTLMLIAIIILASYKFKGHIRAKLKHPMIVSIKIWAFAHLLVNGDLASLILFSSFLAWAVYARISLKKRAQSGIDSGSDFTPSFVHDLAAIAIGLALYAALMLFAHEWLIGVPVM